MPASELMISVVEAYVAGHTTGDVDAVVALFAPDAVVRDPADGGPYEGHEAIRSFFTATHELVDRLELVRTGPVRCTGRHAAFPFRAISTMGDTRLGIDIIDVFSFDDEGRIVEMDAYWSMADARPVD